jgi:hypothetical protein
MSGARTGLERAEERRLFGWGIASEPLDPAVIYSRDITLSVKADGTRDLVLVDGLAALEQDLVTAFATALGGDPLNSAFGFDGLRIIGEELDPLMLRERLRGAVVQLLRADPRVIAVLQVLIGEEVPPPPVDPATGKPPKREIGVVEILAIFRIVGGTTTRVRFGPVTTGA